MSRIGVLHLIDTLEVGGAERAVVNLANEMPRDLYRCFVCTTRREGPLARALRPDVGRLQLQRRRTLDLAALRRLVSFLRREEIQILHCHDTALLLANLALGFRSRPAIVWHDHFGPNAELERNVWLYRLLTKRVAGVVAVSEDLRRWSRDRLGVSEDRLSYLPNFAVPAPSSAPAAELPGKPGRRIACVANLRAVKDHETLIRALEIVVRDIPDAQLLLLGGGEASRLARLRARVDAAGLAEQVSFLGLRDDVPSVLRACDVGVLSSKAEGLPMALLEYGAAGLPAVATRVGQCAEVLGEGAASSIVDPGDPVALAEALVDLLSSPERRRMQAAAFQKRVETVYSANAVTRAMGDLYRKILSDRPGPWAAAP